MLLLPLHILGEFHCRHDVEAAVGWGSLCLASTGISFIQMLKLLAVGVLCAHRASLCLASNITFTQILKLFVVGVLAGVVGVMVSSLAQHRGEPGSIPRFSIQAVRIHA